jgi:C-terminal processing protease CtpA/Prc
VFDMRGYPNGTFRNVLGHLAGRPEVTTPPFWIPVVLEPGMRSALEIPPVLDLRPTVARYEGTTVMLIDERTQSQAEYTGQLFRTVHGTRFIGSPTTGANGDGSNFGVPGGLRVGMSGAGVRNPDGSPLQRVGLQPDVLVRPTIAGIRAGRDEVLERAIAYLKTRSAAPLQ